MGSIKQRLGWIPNLFTLANLTLGFIAILIASRGEAQFVRLAGALILLAMLCDGFDGWTARLLDARSEIGAQLDSLADLTAFGIAPAVVMYNYVLHDYNYQSGEGLSIPVGMLVSAIYPACAAYRLARFNTAHDDDSFAGLPSPVAGITVGLMPHAFGADRIDLPSIILTLIFVLVAFFMVSTIKYAKPQVTILRRFSPVRLTVILIFVTVVLVVVGVRYGWMYAAAGMFTLILLYVAIGLVSLVIHAIQEYRM